jgi:hypothetical protein
MASATHGDSTDRDIGGLERYVIECQELDVHVGVDLAFRNGASGFRRLEVQDPTSEKLSPLDYKSRTTALPSFCM